MKANTIAIAAMVSTFAGAMLLMYDGFYGWTLFTLCPVVLGACAAVLLQPKSGRQAAWLGALVTFIGAFVLIGIKIEGFLCTLLALPITVPMGAIGARLLYYLRERKRPGHAVMLLLLLPASLTWDMNARSEVFRVHSSVEISATPEQVWKRVVAFPDIAEPDEWYFRNGIAYPLRARIEGTGPGAIRYCEFSTGPFVEPIETWDEPRLLHFKVTSNPASMRELNPWGTIQPKHLHGYMVSKEGEFRLTELPDHHTLLEGTTWYQHGLWPAQYWRVWSDAIIHRIHLRVLNHIKAVVEAEALPATGGASLPGQ